jgi:hypothetical protein
MCHTLAAYINRVSLMSHNTHCEEDGVAIRTEPTSGNGLHTQQAISIAICLEHSWT